MNVLAITVIHGFFYDKHHADVVRTHSRVDLRPIANLRKQLTKTSGSKRSASEYY